ncbi:zinc finger and SCAN domain-containing protein 4-like [Octodon degus]|uniref:Zinc finger and SCAN domain-containing protein 4-like n=1 Tax=Octodon degus TaxID=10160 RepID=A0A6P3FVD4_OCTDE|nr:zinc finger and SCAN domain-containing protein 4-like [Octodon degus]
MALDLRKSCAYEPCSNNLKAENMELNSSQDSAITERETSEFSGIELNSFQYSQNSSAKKEIQRLYEMFHSWLQTQKRSKEEIVAQLAVEQFMLSGHCRDKAMLRRRWESSGKELEKFMEDLPDDCMKPPELVHVCMQGQNALFSEDMPLKEVIAHFTRKFSVKTLMNENIQPPFQASQNTAGETRRGSALEEGRDNSSWEIPPVNDNGPNPRNKIVSMLIIPEHNGSSPEEECDSWENAHTTRRAMLGTCRLLEEPHKSYQHVPVDVGQEPSSGSVQPLSEPVPNHHSNEGTPKQVLFKDVCSGSSLGSDLPSLELGCTQHRNERSSYQDVHVSMHEGQGSSCTPKKSSPETVWNHNEVNFNEEISIEVRPGSSMPDLSSPQYIRNQHGNEGNSSLDVSMDVEERSSSESDQPSSEPPTTHHSNQGNPTCEGPQERVPGFSKPYQCEDCPKTFRYFSRFTAHQRRHKNERPFVCAECKKGFFQKSDLRVHQMIHKKEKPFTCTTCEISFTHKTNLRAHQRIHTGEKPYKCPFCKRSFRQSSTYYRHKKMHEKSGLQNVPSTSESSPAATETVMDTNPYRDNCLHSIIQ